MMRGIALLLILAVQALAQSGFNTSECGKTKHCISYPPSCHEDADQSCQYMISHAPNADGTSVNIELFGERDSNEVQYVAAGFSNDEAMGNDSVVACVANPNGKPSLIYSINEGKTNKQNPGVEPSDAELLDSVVTDKVIYCKIRQSIKPADDSLPDLSKSYYVLVARGPRMDSGRIGYHTNREIMPSITNFMQPLALGTPSNGSDSRANQTIQIDNREPVAQGTGPFSLTSSTKRFIIKWHGFLMLTGWFAMIAIGIFSARYLRPATPNTKIGGLHLWFHLHRTLNFLAILIIIVSAILIFVAKDLEWTGPKLGAESEYNYNPGAIHSLIGLIAVLLALTQPLGALMRCAPSDSRRPIFNWIHRLLGLVATIGALIASYIAINSFTSLWSNHESPIVLIIVYTVAAIFLIIALELFKFTRIRNRRKVTINGMELRNRAKASEDGFETTYHVSHNERTTKDKVVEISGFILFSLISIAFVTLLALFLL